MLLNKSIIIICIIKISSLITFGTGVKINTYKGLLGNNIDYLHLEFQLTKENISTQTPEEWSRCHECTVFDKASTDRDKNFKPNIPCPCNSFDIDEDGSFVIYISKDGFPIETNKCESKWLKCKMASTTTLINPEEVTKIKKELWENIRLLSEGELQNHTIYIELGPYAKITNREKLNIILNYCNIYFRTAAGGIYIDNTHPLDHPENIIILNKK